MALKQADDWDRTGETVYLNVDADVFSTSPLDALVAGLKNKIHVNYLGPESGRFSAHFSLGSFKHSSSADSAILQYVELIERLPDSARRDWNDSQHRAFNIGIQAGVRPRQCEFAIGASTVAAAARVDASITVTVYAAEPTTSGNGDIRPRSRPTNRSTRTGRKRPAG